MDQIQNMNDQCHCQKTNVAPKQNGKKKNDNEI